MAYDDSASNLFLKKVGANRWLPFIITMCGVCGMCIGFVQNYAGLLAARVVLGIFNGGILTGVVRFLGFFCRDCVIIVMHTDVVPEYVVSKARASETVRIGSLN